MHAGSTLLAAITVLAAQAHAACAADNCYNNLSRNSASTFCATYTTTIVTALTGLPTYISTSCGASRLSSACTCLYPSRATETSCQTTVTATTTKTVTATAAAAQPTCMLRNGDFGFDPWFNGDIINESSYGYNTPGVGGPAFAGAAAFQVSFPADGIYELDQYVAFPTTPTTYTLTFHAKATGSCHIIAVIGMTGGPYFAEKDVTLGSAYATYTVTGRTDGGTSGFVALEMQCGGNGGTVWIDAVTLQ